MFQFLLGIALFLLGYWIAKKKYVKKIAISKLLGVCSYIKNFCADKQEMSLNLLEAIKNDPDNESNASKIGLLSALTNIHDEMVENYEKIQIILTSLSTEDDLEKIQNKIDAELEAASGRKAQ